MSSNFAGVLMEGHWAGPSSDQPLLLVPNKAHQPVLSPGQPPHQRPSQINFLYPYQFIVFLNFSKGCNYFFSPTKFTLARIHTIIFL